MIDAPDVRYHIQGEMGQSGRKEEREKEVAERAGKGKEAEEGQVWGRCMKRLKWEEARVPCVHPSYNWKWCYKWHQSSCGSEWQCSFH